MSLRRFHLFASLLALPAFACAGSPSPVVPQAGSPSSTMAPPLAFGMPGMAKPAAPATSSDAVGEGEKKKPNWDIEAPTGPTKDVSIDTAEGTWMSLDVSPDGKTIVFDLLGDLYSIPMEGGEAKSLSSGMAWDMQPRFSPDGKWLAFTSDRDGADNIWVMEADGKNPRQITKEDFRLVNSPSWTPDGQWIAARKHFTAERSLGTGEIWLYHRSGGKGLPMTEKPNDQKDVGEPALSPDGRYLYFSQDTTPGAEFQYNKNPHAGIYTIKRLDRVEQRVEPYISTQGGAVRPTPSRDGKLVAFVRRVGLQTALFLHNTVSGEDKLLRAPLDRDMQETWAIHGVYPSMAFTPDNSSIVVWAGGKINRVDVSSGAVTNIPFHVKDSRKVVSALRFPVEAHPARFDTKMLRFVEVSPDGKSVVYQSLGRLYVFDLQTKKARPLTTDKGYFEQEPAFSRDGKTIVYTTFGDETLSRIRVVSAAGGQGKLLLDKPGHYVEPTISPDGKNVVFRKIAGGGIRSRLYSQDTGIYVLPMTGGEPRLVTRKGFSPHFGADSDRVFFLVDGEDKEKKRELHSIDLDGSDERTHLRSENATEIRVSPDGRYVVFQELFQGYITPMPVTGRVVDIGPKTEGLPVARVTKTAGDYLQFSGDSKRIHWSLGPELFTRALTDSFAFLAGAPEKLPEPPELGTPIGFSVDSDAPTGKLALVGARIVTMKGKEVLDEGTIMIDRNRIVAIGKSADIVIPADATRIDVHGKTIIPGLVDVHAHGPQGSDGIIPERNWLHYAELAFGVTTTHDPSNDTATIFAAAEMARAGLLVAPRIYSTGTILYGAKAAFKAVIEDLDQAREHLRRLHAVGAFSVKSYNQPRRSQRQQVLAAARELGMMVVPEGGSLFEHNMTMVVDGHTGVEHALPIGRGYSDMVQLWSGTEVGYTPTLVVGYGGLWGENYWYAHSDVFAHPRLTQFVPPEDLEPRSRRRLFASDGDWNHFEIARLCKQLADAGVRINLGAHGQREGLAAHWEMWMLVQGGMTPHEAMAAATINGAHYIGLDKDLGSLEPGKLADLVVIDGNPLANIRVSEKVLYTVINGRIFDAATMNEIGNHPRKRGKFFWER